MSKAVRKLKLKHFSDGIELMYQGALVAHEDWQKGEYITIEQGEFVDEDGKLFTLSPWMINDAGFYVFKAGKK